MYTLIDINSTHTHYIHIYKYKLTWLLLILRIKSIGLQGKKGASTHDFALMLIHMLNI